MGIGRPRIYDREKIFQDLLEWAKLPDSINLCKFCAINELDPDLILQWSRDEPELSRTYRTVKSFIGARREELLNKNKLHTKAYDLNATNYDFFLKDEKRQQLEYEASLKSSQDSQENTYHIKVNYAGPTIEVSPETLSAENPDSASERN
ncbi:MAG TPA: hypothetical protein VHZ50_16330 [Puia sp.]|jgi:hypothetical protein|nr:hypothetical protein [Puia sp.]